MNNDLSRIMLLLSQATPEKCEAVLALLEDRLPLAKEQTEDEEEWKPQRLYSIKDVSRMIGRSSKTVRCAMKTGKLPFIQLTGKNGIVQFYERDVKNWIGRTLSSKEAPLVMKVSWVGKLLD